MLRFVPFSIGLLFLSVVGCADADSPDTEPADQPVDGKADIYGNDDRHDLATVSSQTAKRVGDSTVVLLSKYRVSSPTNGQVRLLGQRLGSKQEAIHGQPLCPEERFQSEPAPGFCSGFLIAPDLVATAGHCVSVETGCNGIAVAFGFDNRDGDAANIPEEDVRHCEAIVGHLFDRETMRDQPITSTELYSDWAIMKLDRPVEHRVPLSLRGTPVSAGEQVIAVGHPGGVPTKVTYGKVTADPHRVWFNTDLDIYQGNSGSVVVDRNGSAVGIVSRGSGGMSYIPDTSRQCMVSSRCDEVDENNGRCVGNQAVRVDALNRFMRAEPVQLDWDGGWSSPIPLDGSPLQIPFELEAEGFVHYVTMTTRISHENPRELEYSLVAPDGTRRIVMDRPVAWRKLISEPARTTFAFDDSEPTGTWFLEVRDTAPSATGSQRVEKAQLVFGISDVAPDAPPTWVGSACATDADCTFENRGTPGQCLQGTGGGFCTLPCEGFCPDREGFASTFCIESDMGTGTCAATPAVQNSFCDAVPGTTSQVRERFIGGSAVQPGALEVCAPH